MKQQVLVIDDEQHVRDDLTTFLQDEGYIVNVAKSIAEATEAMRKPLNFAIIDLNLGEGLSLVGGLNAYLYFLRQKPDVKTIILSAYPFENVREMLSREISEGHNSTFDILQEIQRNYVYKGDGNYIDAIISKLKSMLNNFPDANTMNGRNASAIENNDRITKVYTTHIHGNVGAYSQGGEKYSQYGEVNISDSEVSDKLNSFLDEFKDNLLNLPINNETKKKAETCALIVEDQLKEQQPNKQIVTESLKTIRSILEDCAGSTLATGLIQLLSKLF